MDKVGIRKWGLLQSRIIIGCLTQNGNFSASIYGNVKCYKLSSLCILCTLITNSLDSIVTLKQYRVGKKLGPN